MKQLKELSKLKKFSNLPPRKKLNVFKIVFLVNVALLTVVNFLSLIATGSTFMIWKDMQTESMEQVMQFSHKSFFTSQQLIIAFDVLCLFVLGLLTFSVFKFYTKGNFIIMYFIVVLGGAMGSLVIFLVYRLRTERGEPEEIQLKPIVQIFKMLWYLIDDKKGELLNYVECGKIILWKELQGFQTGYLVITILSGIVLFVFAYKTNHLDVKYSQENQVELTESN